MSQPFSEITSVGAAVERLRACLEQARAEKLAYEVDLERGRIPSYTTKAEMQRQAAIRLGAIRAFQTALMIIQAAQEGSR
jgi:hypothetical protein